MVYQMHIVIQLNNTKVHNQFIKLYDIYIPIYNLFLKQL